MYRERAAEGPGLEDFYLPFGGHLNQKNRWVLLSRKIPWNEIEQEYRKGFFSKYGSSREICQRDIPGCERFGNEEPFSASLLPSFRSRCNREILEKLNNILFRDYQEEIKKTPQVGEETQEEEIKENRGELIIDRERYGVYLESIHADQIYLNRENRRLCREVENDKNRGEIQQEKKQRHQDHEAEMKEKQEIFRTYRRAAA